MQDDQLSSDTLTMFSFDQIVAEIDLKRVSARKGTESWDRLRAVATELAGESATNKTRQPTDRTWQLEQVSIQSYRGIANQDPLTLTFDPTPGITVLHGLNGAGKSSVSDAIEVGLTGRTPASQGGTAGKAALWEPIHLTRGASEALIEVTLSAGQERLTIETRLGPGGTVQSHTASIELGNSRSAIDLDASWQQALASHQPVFAYAALERRVQLSKHLAEYFEGLLALGGSFAAIQETIAARGAASMEALERWRVAKDDAMHALAKVDRDHELSNSAILMKPVVEPIISQDRDDWLDAADLLAAGPKSNSLPSNARSLLSDTAVAVSESITRLNEAGVLIEQQLSGALEHLYSEAKARNIDDLNCPVCAAPDTDWLNSLQEAVSRTRHITGLRTKVSDEMKQLADLGETLLDLVLRVGEQASENDPIVATSSIGRDLLNTFAAARDIGIATNYSALGSATALSDWLRSKETGTLIDEAIARTDATKQWRIARARAVEDFVAIWKVEADAGVQSALWKETSKRVEEVRVHLRKKRSASLEGKAGQRVKELLADAELQLTGISVLTTKASMELIDRNGSSVDLGMLSAGQRNAVLLAPLLASVDAGPFGFLILDDPVHAFDELRVDRLADSLAKLAETRRVVVLTHDDRLKENLAARSITCDTRLVDRSPSTGFVQITDSSHFWDQLLTDAGTIHDLAVKETGTTKDVSASIRGLCRISLDNALRTFALRNAVIFSRDTLADMDALDRAFTTKARLDVATQFWQGPSDENPVPQAVAVCAPHFHLWNQAVHGNDPVIDASRSEIRAAREACKALVAGP